MRQAKASDLCGRNAVDEHPMIWSITKSTGTEVPVQQFPIKWGREGSSGISKVKGDKRWYKIKFVQLYITKQVSSGHSVPAIRATTDNPDPAF